MKEQGNHRKWGVEYADGQRDVNCQIIITEEERDCFFFFQAEDGIRDKGM